MQVLKQGKTVLNIHNRGDWFTVSHNKEFYYSGEFIKGVAVFDDWMLSDIKSDCLEAVEILEAYGYKVKGVDTYARDNV